jgi:hypothetical protein
VNNDRQKAIEQTLGILNALVKRYQGPLLCCDTPESGQPDNARRACDGMILGTLLKSAAEKGLYPPPKSPYEGWSFGTVTLGVMGLNISSLCHDKFLGKNRYGEQESHGVGKALSSEVGTLYDNTFGVSLSSFK